MRVERTKGILAGHPAPEEIAALVRGFSDSGRAEVKRADDMAWVVFDDPESGTDRQMRVEFETGDASPDDPYPIRGDRTVVSLGAFDASVVAVEAVISHFGGYVMDNDCHAAWREVPKKAVSVIELTPYELLSYELARILPPKVAAGVHAAAADRGKLEALLQSLSTWHRS